MWLIIGLLTLVSILFIYIYKSSISLYHYSTKTSVSPFIENLYKEIKMHPESSAYNSIFVTELHGPVDRKRLAFAIRIVVYYSDGYNRFEEKHGVTYRLSTVDTRNELALKYFDFTNKENPKQEALDWLKKFTKKEYNLYKNGLYDFVLIKYDKESYMFAVQGIHLVADGGSTHLFLMATEFVYNHPYIGPILLWTGKKLGYFPTHEQYLNHYWGKFGSKIQESEIYWDETLKNAKLKIDFNVPKPSESYNDFAGKRIFFTLSDSANEKLLQFVKREKVTTFITLSSLFIGFLHKYFNQDDITIVYPNNIRLKGYQYMIGFFVNLLPLRIKVEKNETFRQLLKKVSDKRWEDRQHNQCPSGKFLNATKTKGIFPNVSIANSVVKYNTSLNQVKSKLVFFDEFDAQRDLTLFYDDYNHKGENITFWIEYKRCIFRDDFMERMIDNFKVFVEEAIDHPNIPLNEISFLSQKERDLILNQFNQTDSKSTFIEKSIQEIVEENAIKFSNCIALHDHRGQKITYKELNEKANQLAHLLRERGVTREMIVGIGMDRSIEFVISILATVKAGAAYLPLDTSYPKDRLEFILKDAQVLHLITKSEYCTFFDTFDGDVICWNDDMEYEITNPKNVNQSNDMVYVIYTSGSTGKPKGCILTQQNLLNFCYDHIHTLKLDQSSRILSMASICFDVCTDEIWLAMTSGACLVIPSEHIRKDPLLLIDFIESMEITVACFTPMYLKMIPKQPIRGLKVIEIAGDVCDYETMAYWSKHVTFFNGYGPTETNYATVKKWTEYDLAQNIGKPMYNCKCYILDEYLKPVPIGNTGELYIGGLCVGRGYLNKPEMTKERFLDDPFNKGFRMYKTGDLARWLPNGDIEYIGRIDFQVKIRGYRVELSEIENVIRKCDHVKDCVVIYDRQIGQLIACINTQYNDTKELESNILSKLRREITDYMIPSHYMFLNKFPSTSTGKIDRQTLLKEFAKRRDLPTSTTSSASNTKLSEPQRILLNIVSELLKKPDIGLDDNFFEMGGNSISAIQLRIQAKKKGIQFEMKDIFQQQTINGLLRVAQIERKPTNNPIAKLKRQKSNSLVIPPGIGKPVAQHRRRNSLIKMFQTRVQNLFLIHPASGLVFCFDKLIELMKDKLFDVTIYGIQNSNMYDDESPVYSSIEEFAKEYVQLIREVQPQGPYMLGGYSLGGIIAYEVCKQMKSIGENVDLLVMIDSGYPPSLEYKKEKKNSVQLILESFGYEKFEIDCIMQLSREAQKKKILGIITEKFNTSIAAFIESCYDRFMLCIEKSYQAYFLYRPEPLDQQCKIIFFESATQEFGSNKAKGWSEMVSHKHLFNVVHCKSGHYDMLEDDASIIADALAEEIQLIKVQNNPSLFSKIGTP